ncbi:hypothetical protein, partial [Atlantibacter sp.]|uniref:hypothetical protein n=1 Tax=Atlantibacter sp. TaxID=1903473 RepID=UPI0028A7C454
MEWFRSLWQRVFCQYEFCGMVPFAKSGLPHAAWLYANVPGGLAAAPLATPAPPDVTAASRCPPLTASAFGPGATPHP